MLFEFIQLKIASPYLIRFWCSREYSNGEIRGEVANDNTVNYRTFKPIKGGLFCEQNFGPIKSLKCECGKYQHKKDKGHVCEICDIEIINSNVRRQRMGFIKLSSSVTHVWFLKSRPSIFGLLLNFTSADIEDIMSHIFSVIVKPGKHYKNIVLSEFLQKSDTASHGEYFTGSEALKFLLDNLNLDEVIELTRLSLQETKEKSRHKIKDAMKKKLRKLRIVKHFKSLSVNPAWMVLDIIPVLPPEIRPLVHVGDGQLISSDLNELYRRVIRRNSRLFTLKKFKAGLDIIQAEQRLIQEAVDNLMDNGRRSQPVLNKSGIRPLKSLSDVLKGKQGRFRQNLLGKRVDYSGRSVIVSGPELCLSQCGLPREMALQLFEPFLIHTLIAQKLAPNVFFARRILRARFRAIWSVIEEFIYGHFVILNRAPTLHLLGIQAFEPILIRGNAIRLHPLSCPGFNADFDGDQMAVHIPLSLESQIESRYLMSSVTNLTSPAHGNLLAGPTQDTILGLYFLTIENPYEEYVNHYFADPTSVIKSHELGNLTTNTFIWVRVLHKVDFKHSSKLLRTTKITYFSQNTIVKTDLQGNIKVTYIKTTPGRILLSDRLNPTYDSVGKLV